MTQHLTENFIDLSDRRLGTNRSPELALNHREGRLNIRPLVVVSQERILVEVVEVPHPGGTIMNHFADVSKMVALGDGASRDIGDIVLSRYACQLIAMNGDPMKPEIAGAQAYFAVQTRRQELFDQLSEAEKRVVLRDRVKDANKHLSGAAKEAGVQNWGLFQESK